VTQSPKYKVQSWRYQSDNMTKI